MFCMSIVSEFPDYFEEIATNLRETFIANKKSFPIWNENLESQLAESLKSSKAQGYTEQGEKFDYLYNVLQPFRVLDRLKAGLDEAKFIEWFLDNSIGSELNLDKLAYFQTLNYNFDIFKLEQSNLIGYLKGFEEEFIDQSLDVDFGDETELLLNTWSLATAITPILSEEARKKFYDKYMFWHVWGYEVLRADILNAYIKLKLALNSSHKVKDDLILQFVVMEACLFRDNQKEEFATIDYFFGELHEMLPIINAALIAHGEAPFSPGELEDCMVLRAKAESTKPDREHELNLTADDYRNYVKALFNWMIMN